MDPEPVWAVLANRKSLVPAGTGSIDLPGCSLSLHRLRYPGCLEINADYKKQSWKYVMIICLASQRSMNTIR